MTVEAQVHIRKPSRGVHLELTRDILIEGGPTCNSYAMTRSRNRAVGIAFSPGTENCAIPWHADEARNCTCSMPEHANMIYI